MLIITQNGYRKTLRRSKKDVFWRRDQSLTMDVICRRLGIAKKTVYKESANKKELVKAIFHKEFYCFKLDLTLALNNSEDVDVPCRNVGLLYIVFLLFLFAHVFPGYLHHQFTIEFVTFPRRKVRTLLPRVTEVAKVCRSMIIHSFPSPPCFRWIRLNLAMSEKERLV